MGQEFKKGALVMLLRANHAYSRPFVGTVQVLNKMIPFQGELAWTFENVLRNGANRVLWRQRDMRVIGDQPGADETLSWCNVPTTKRLTEEEFKAAEVKWGEKV